uniref:Uncharacterized protein n=1 Tax=Rhizophora mucronata TaxID=61149 RepID=A0A2P2Q154_RHIMU
MQAVTHFNSTPKASIVAIVATSSTMGLQQWAMERVVEKSTGW